MPPGRARRAGETGASPGGDVEVLRALALASHDHQLAPRLLAVQDRAEDVALASLTEGTDLPGAGRHALLQSIAPFAVAHRTGGEEPGGVAAGRDAVGQCHQYLDLAGW